MYLFNHLKNLLKTRKLEALETLKLLEFLKLSIVNINPIQDGLFWGYSRIGWEGGLFGPPSLKSATHILQ